MKVRPLGDRVLIKRIEPKEVVRGGIIIPDTAKEKPLEAEVVSLGQGRRTEDGKTISFEVKAGDKVLVGKYAGQDITIDGNEYVILREEDIMAVLQ